MHKPLKLGLLALGLAFILDILIYKQEPGLNVPLASLAFLGTTYAAMYIGGHPVPMRAHIAALFSFLFAVPFAIGTSEHMYSLATLGFLSSHLLFAAFVLGQESRFNHPLEIFWSGTIKLSIRLLERFTFIGKMKPPALSSRHWAVGKGLIILVPLLIIFMALFASADPIFKSYFETLGDWLGSWGNISDVVAQLFIIGFFFLVLAPFFGAAAYERFAHEPRQERDPSWITESKVILAGLVVLFAAFLILQGSVMFGGTTAFERIDMTYAEYARQGFNQLIFASVLVAFIILTLRDQHGVKTDNVLTLLHTAFIVETLLVLVSAAMRLSMYIDAYGYTDARLFAYWTIITIGILLVLLLANVIQRESQVTLMNRALIVLGVSAAIFCFSMPDAMSARLNLRRIEAGKPVDFQSFIQLSEEATPIIIEALQRPLDFKNTHPSLIANWLTSDVERSTGWRSWNYSWTRSNDLLPAPRPDWLQQALEETSQK